MKSITRLFSLVCLFMYSIIQAQPQPDELITGSIKGAVIDKTLNQPIPYATVIIKDTEDNTITGGITDDEGLFEIEKIPEGNFTVKIQFIGYETYTTPITITKGNRDIDLKTIYLNASASELNEVTVVSERTTIEQQIDRKVITVGKDLTTSGPTASDIMNNIPSVSIDQQTGEIAMRGNSNVRVMVDGKLSNIPAAQLLKQLPSNAIKKIELITNPSAKYNPEGMSGIINIILHKNANIGFNGDVNLSYTYEKEPKINSGLNLNYRNGKFNLYGNYSNNISKSVNYGTIKTPDDNTTQYFDILNDNDSHNFKVGLDFYLNEKNTVSVFTSQNMYDGNSTAIMAIKTPDNPSNNIDQNLENEDDNNSSQYNFDYKLDFEKEGHNLEFEVDLNNYSGDQVSDFGYSGNTPIQDYQDLLDIERNRTTINLDYVNPLAEGTKLEIGVQSILFDTDNNYASTGLTYNASGDLVPIGDTRFEYSRDIHSAYITYGKKLEKWSYQAGLRAESVTVAADTNQIEAFKNDYLQVYPSAYLTYNPSEKNQYQISYSRRVDRPGLNQINPIREWSSPRITNYGNIKLLPQFTNSVEFNYTRQLEKGSITTGVFYRIIEDEINQALFVDRIDINRVVLTFDNFDNTSAYGFEVSGNFKPLEWWSINSSFDVYNQTQRGLSETLDPAIENPTVTDIITLEREVQNTAFNVRLINNFSASKNLKFTAFSMYRGKNQNLQFNMKSMFLVNVGARYTFLDNKATASLNYNDVFNTMKARFEGDYPYKHVGQFNWESNTVNLALNYRFGEGKYKAKRRKNRDDNEKDGGGIF